MFGGRDAELSSLGELLAKPIASIVACRGRRRIGKSTLFREFARRNRLEFIVIEGLGPRKGQTNADQLRNFGERLSAQTKGKSVSPESWMEAFRALADRLPKKRRTLVLLDEISWMGRHEPDFAGLLKNGWDDYLKSHDNLILAVCGSVSAWVRKNLLDSAAFGGRFSKDIVLRELSLRDCVKFWGDRAKDLASREILDVLSVTGGVPRYLEDVNPSLSAAENIRRMCFSPDGPLFKDFASMFGEVFGGNAVVKGDILEALADGSKTCSEIAASLGVDRGGSLSDSLDELREAGFVSKDQPLNPTTWKPTKLARYRLCDNYARFYLKYIKPHEKEIREGRYVFDSLSELPGWQTIMGFQFENLVVNRVMDLRGALNLSGVPIRAAAPYAVSGKGGVQVDLLVQTDDVMYVIEIKRRKVIPASVVEDVRAKVARLRLRRRVSLRKGLVCDGELAPTIRRSAYFDAVVEVAPLMGIGR